MKWVYKSDRGRVTTQTHVCMNVEVEGVNRCLEGGGERWRKKKK